MHSNHLLAFSIASAATLLGCATDPAADDAVWGDGKGDGVSTVGIAATALNIDIAGLTGVATIELESDRSNVELDTSALTITKVSDDTGERRYDVVDGQLRVAAVTGPLVVEYGFGVRDHTGGFQDGYLPGGSTFTHPYFCGNLFPCHTRTADGSTFTLSLTGVEASKQAIYPSAIEMEVPAYQLAWAIGDYRKRELGTTTAGTTISAYTLPGDEIKSALGTKRLVAAFDWLERTIGPYPFGSEVATVDVAWRTGAGGPTTHHPFFHVASAFYDHEAAHLASAIAGWFGDAVRPRCWEDLVLAQGTAMYLSLRVREEFDGAAVAKELWDDYYSRLIGSEAGNGAPAWPVGCNQIDPIWGRMLIDQGAFFYKDVATHVGVAELDRVIGTFYRTYAGRAAGMQDMLDMIEAETGFDPTTLAEGHLRVRSTIKVVPL
jgi:aminopeptidase N